jgi:tetratricopeptide (TPR) repeat protein/energy-coupling factor transporter ATP-binding protein EcfA2
MEPERAIQLTRPDTRPEPSTPPASATVIPPRTDKGGAFAHKKATFGIFATTPPLTDQRVIAQRADEVDAVLRMLIQRNTSAVLLIGNPGVGKSTLAALLYQRLLLAQQAGMPAPRHLVWLTLDTYTTLPDLIAAILKGVKAEEPALFLLTPEQQISTLLRALRRRNENALVVIDQFELLLHPETQQGAAGRGSLPLFLQMLQTDLGGSRLILTSYNSPYNEEMAESRVRSYLVSRITMPEGEMLLQQRGVEGSPEALSLVWQRCAGHVFALTLVHALLHLGNLSLDQLLEAPENQALWNGEVAFNLCARVYQHLNPTQNAIVRMLSLFHELVPFAGIAIAILGNSALDVQERQRVLVFEQALHTLVQFSLVQEVTEQGIRYYTLHSLLRQYVLEHFLEGGDSKEEMEAREAAIATAHLHIANYYRLVVQREMPPRGQRHSLQDVGPLISVVRHLCLGRRWQLACNTIFEERLHESLVQWGALGTLIGLYTAMLPPFGKLEQRDEALVMSHLAMLYGRTGEYQQSQFYYQKALTIQHNIGDTHGEAVTLTNQGEIFRLSGNLEQARANFEQALLLDQQRPDPRLRCVLLHNIGLLYHNVKDYATAREYYLQALRQAYSLATGPLTHGKSNSMSSQVGLILTNLGMLLYEQKQRQEAIALLIAAIQLRRSLHDPTVGGVERFMAAVEQKMGAEAFAELCRSAIAIQNDLLTQLVA